MTLYFSQLYGFFLSSAIEEEEGLPMTAYVTVIHGIK